MEQTQTSTARPPRLRKSEPELIPPFVGRLLIVLLLSALAVVTWARLTDQPLIATKPESPVIAERLFRFDADMAGSVRVMDADGALLASLPPEQGGFISGVGRVIARERTKNRIALDGPVLLMRHENGRYSLRDPSTGWEVDLMGFGLDNARAFARLLAL